jgi:hypothetical protein
MKVSSTSLVLISILANDVSAFAPSSQRSASASVPSSALNLHQSNNNNNEQISRRSTLESMTASTLALLIPQIASASLLDDFGTDPSKIQEVEKKENKPAVAQPKADSTLEPNLRSNYYYPTNKKRYLPRIKKCNDAIPFIADAIGDEDWDIVNDFVTKVADDTILPMKLYTSSLTGGGTNVKVSFTKDMMNEAEKFEKAQKALAKAVKKKDKPAASTALEQLATSLLTYRTVGRLLGPDGGGDIPSVDEIRRSACRVQGRTFEQKVKDRDARVAAIN